MLRITDTIVIPFSELRFTTSRSSGPGGQHVNTTDTRVSLLFDVAHSPSLTQLQKVVATGKLRRRIDKDGVLHVNAQKFRSQKSNKDSAVERFVELMRDALTPIAERRETAAPKSAKRRRLERKRRTAERKRLRRVPDADNEY